MAYIKTIRGFTPQLDENVFLCETATIIGDVSIGKNSSIWFNVVLRGDVNRIVIGNNTNIQDGTIIHTLYQKSTVNIGDFVSIGHGAIIHGADIESYALIGMGSILLDHVKVGEGAIVGAGSLVLSGTEIPAGSIYAGNPAKYIKMVDPKQSREMNEKIVNNYLSYAAWYKEEENKHQF